MLVRLVNGIASALGGGEMLRFIFRRVLISIPVLLTIIFGAFILIRLVPGGPFSSVGARQRDAASLATLNARYGLDKPLFLNLPSDGVAPDVGMESRTLYEVQPLCSDLVNGMSEDDARTKAKAAGGVEVEQGWSLLHTVTEHTLTYITVNVNGAPKKIRCDEARQVTYSDLTRSQFLQYLNNVLRLNFGESLGQTTRGQDVTDVILKGLPRSALLGTTGAFFGFLLGIPLGVIAALNRNGAIDYGATFLSTVSVSVPSFVLGPLLIIVFVNGLHWFPGPDPKPWLDANLLDPKFWPYLALPMFTLILGVSAGIGRLTRASVLQVLQDDYIRTARAKGMRERSVIYVHALKNALIPVITILGPLLAGILTGTFFVELIFAIPGLGSTFITSVGERDYTLLTGATILYATALVLGNIMVDVMYTWLDPRIRFD